jgi:cobalamin transport system substrate-binding protein
VRRGGRRWLALAALAALGGCSQPPPAPGGAAAAGPRLVVLAPGIAETLAALGLADRVVGVGDFVTWPPRFLDLPRVGAYDTPNEERVLELRTDLLLTAASREASPSLARLRGLGVEVMELDTSTYSGTLAAIERLGERLGRRERARRLAASIRRRLGEVRRRAAGAPKRRVLVVVGRDPLYVAGPGSHFDEMIDLAGGINVAADAHSPYQLFSREAMLERLPEVIVDTSDNRPGALRGRTPGPWREWPFLPAVAADRVYWVDPARLVIPGPRLPRMTLLMGEMIHPEVFGEATAGELGPLTGTWEEVAGDETAVQAAGGGEGGDGEAP